MLKKCLLLIMIISYILLTAVPTFSAALPGVRDIFIVNQTIQNKAISDWLPRVSQYTLGLLWTTSLIAFAIGCKDLALSGGGIQLEGIAALIVRFAFLTGLVSWILSDARMLFFIPDSLDKLGGYIATGSYDRLSFTKISSAFSGIMMPIIDFYRTIDWTSPGLLLMCVVLVFLINCLSILFISVVILVRLETVFIVIGGMFTAAFFILGYFRDMFMGYIKALAMNGLKLLLLSLCLNLLADLIDEWKIYFNVIEPAVVYDTIIPMTFALMAFYIVVRSVPQYAVAILTGHATADGGLARAAVAAGAFAGTTVWNLSRGISQSSINTAQAVKNGVNAYLNTTQTKIDSKGNETSGSRAMGAWEAIKALATSNIGTNREDTRTTGNNSNNSSKNGGNPSTTIDAEKADRMYPGSKNSESK